MDRRFQRRYLPKNVIQAPNDAYSTLQGGRSRRILWELELIGDSLRHLLEQKQSSGSFRRISRESACVTDTGGFKTHFRRTQTPRPPGSAPDCRLPLAAALTYPPAAQQSRPLCTSNLLAVRRLLHFKNLFRRVSSLRSRGRNGNNYAPSVDHVGLPPPRPTP
jgi:hypothetical protein